MKNYKVIDQVTFLLVALGGICLGLMGAFAFNLIGSIFHPHHGHGMSVIERIIYVLIGLSAVYRLFFWIKARI